MPQQNSEMILAVPKAKRIPTSRINQEGIPDHEEGDLLLKKMMKDIPVVKITKTEEDRTMGDAQEVLAEAKVEAEEIIIIAAGEIIIMAVIIIIIEMAGEIIIIMVVIIIIIIIEMAGEIMDVTIIIIAMTGETIMEIAGETDLETNKTSATTEDK